MNNFAISSGGIGNALTRSAASLSAGGNTLEESIGMITAANTVVQNPESVGTTLKTVSMYLRAAKEDAEAAGIESDDMASSVSEVRSTMSAITKGKVDIMKDANTFKSTFEILSDVADVWDSLTDVDQAAVTKLIGGKRNANVVSALISNWDIAESATATASNSSGSALKENQNVLNSYQGQINQLSASAQDIGSRIFNSGIMNTGLGIAQLGMNTVTGMMNTFGTSQTLGGLGMGLFSMATNNGFFQKYTTPSGGIGIGTFSTAKKAAELNKTAAQIKAVYDNAMTGVTDIDTFNKLSTSAGQVAGTANKTYGGASSWSNAFKGADVAGTMSGGGSYDQRVKNATDDVWNNWKENQGSYYGMSPAQEAEAKANISQSITDSFIDTMTTSEQLALANKQTGRIIANSGKNSKKTFDAEKIAQSAQDAVNNSSNMEDAAKNVGNAVTKSVDGASKQTLSIGQKFKNFGTSIKEAFQANGGGVQGALSATKTALSGATNAAKSIGSSMLSGIKNIGSSLVSGLANGAIGMVSGWALEAIVGGVSNLVTKSYREAEAGAQAAVQTNESLANLETARQSAISTVRQINSGTLNDTQLYQAKEQLNQTRDIIATNYGVDSSQLSGFSQYSESAINNLVDSVGLSQRTQYLRENAKAISDGLNYMNEGFSWETLGLDSNNNSIIFGALEKAAAESNGKVKLNYNPDTKYRSAVLKYTGTRADFKDTMQSVMGVVDNLSADPRLNDSAKNAVADIQNELTKYSSFVMDDKYSNYETALNTAVQYWATDRSEYKYKNQSIAQHQSELDDAITSGDSQKISEAIKNIEKDQYVIENMPEAKAGKAEGMAVQRYFQDKIDNSIDTGKSALLRSDLDKNESLKELKSVVADVPEEMASEFNKIYQNGGKQSESYQNLTSAHKAAYDELDKIVNGEGEYAAYKGASFSNIISSIQDYGSMVSEATKQDRSIENAQTKYSALATEIDNINKVLLDGKSGNGGYGSISPETYTTMGEDYASALEYKNGRYVYNADAIREITEAKVEETVATNELAQAQLEQNYIKNAAEIQTATTKLAAYTKLQEESAKYATYDSTTGQITGYNSKSAMDSAVAKNADLESGSIEDLINTEKSTVQGLVSSQTSVLSQLDQYDIANANLRESTSDYTQFINAQSAGEAGDMLRNIMTGVNYIEDVGDSEKNAYQKVGSNKYNTAAELIMPDSVDKNDDATVQAYNDALASSYLQLDKETSRNPRYYDINFDAARSRLIEDGLLVQDGNGYKWADNLSVEKIAHDFQLDANGDGINDGLSVGFARALVSGLEEYGIEDTTVSNNTRIGVAAADSLGKLQTAINNGTISGKTGKGKAVSINGQNLNINTDGMSPEEAQTTLKDTAIEARRIMRDDKNSEEVKQQASDVLTQAVTAGNNLKYSALTGAVFSKDNFANEKDYEFVSALQDLATDKNTIDLKLNPNDVQNAKKDAGEIGQTLSTGFEEQFQKFGLDFSNLDLSTKKGLNQAMQQIEGLSSETIGQYLTDTVEAAKTSNIIADALSNLEIKMNTDEDGNGTITISKKEEATINKKSGEKTTTESKTAESGGETKAGSKTTTTKTESKTGGKTTKTEQATQSEQTTESSSPLAQLPSSSSGTAPQKSSTGEKNTTPKFVEMKQKEEETAAQKQQQAGSEQRQQLYDSLTPKGTLESFPNGKPSNYAEGQIQKQYDEKQTEVTIGTTIPAISDALKLTADGLTGTVLNNTIDRNGYPKQFDSQLFDTNTGRIYPQQFNDPARVTDVAQGVIGAVRGITGTVLNNTIDRNGYPRQFDSTLFGLNTTPTTSTLGSAINTSGASYYGRLGGQLSGLDAQIALQNSPIGNIALGAAGSVLSPFSSVMPSVSSQLLGTTPYTYSQSATQISKQMGELPQYQSGHQEQLNTINAGLYGQYGNTYQTPSYQQPMTTMGAIGSVMPGVSPIMSGIQSPTTTGNTDAVQIPAVLNQQTVEQSKQQIQQTVAQEQPLQVPTQLTDKTSPLQQANTLNPYLTQPTPETTTAAQSVAEEESKTVSVDVQADTTSVEEVTSALDEIDGKEVEATATVEADTGETEEVNTALDEVDGKKAEAEVTVEADSTQIDEVQDKIASLSSDGGEVSVDVDTSPLETAANMMQEALENLSGGEAQIAPEIDTSAIDSAIESIQSAMEGLSEASANITIEANGDSAISTLEEVESARSQLDGSSATVNIDANDNASGVIESVSSALSALDGQSATVHVNVEQSGSVGSAASYAGTANANGTANAGGTAHAQGTAHKGGSWGAEKSETALVGELGAEILVRGNRWQTIGDDGAEFRHIRQGDIIFNHRQSEELLKNGHIGSRGTMVGGSAHAQGTAYKLGIDLKKSGAGTYSSKTTISTENMPEYGINSGYFYDKVNNAYIMPVASGDSELPGMSNIDKFESWVKKFYDWIQVRIERLSSKIETFVTKSERQQSLGDYKSAIASIQSALKTTLTLIKNTVSGEAKYRSKAEKALSKGVEEYIISKSDAAEIEAKVADGSIALSKYNEDAQKVITTYKEWIDKANECASSIDKLSSNVANYVGNLKALSEAQRDAKIETLDRYTALAENRAVNSLNPSSENVTLSTKNKYLAQKNTASAQAVSTYAQSVKSLGSTAKSKISKEISKTDTKTKSGKAYREKLNSALIAIRSGKKVSTSLLNYFEKAGTSNSTEIWAALYAWNYGLEQEENVRLENTVIQSTNNAEILKNTQAKYSNNRETIENKQDLYLTRAKNASRGIDIDSTKDVANIDKAEAQANYNRASKAITKAETTQSGIKSKANTQSKTAATNMASSKKNGTVDKFITSLQNKMVKGKEKITKSELNKLSEYIKYGYVNANAYNVCVNYNDSFDNYASTQKTLDTAKAKSNEINIYDLAQGYQDQKKIKAVEKAETANNAAANDFETAQKAGKKLTTTANTKSDTKSMQSKVEATVKNATTIMKAKKKVISDGIMKALKGYKELGFVDSSFYNACVTYNSEMTKRLTAEKSKNEAEQFNNTWEKGSKAEKDAIRTDYAYQIYNKDNITHGTVTTSYQNREVRDSIDVTNAINANVDKNKKIIRTSNTAIDNANKKIDTAVKDASKVKTTVKKSNIKSASQVVKEANKVISAGKKKITNDLLKLIKGYVTLGSIKKSFLNTCNEYNDNLQTLNDAKNAQKSANAARKAADKQIENATKASKQSNATRANKYLDRALKNLDKTIENDNAEIKNYDTLMNKGRKGIIKTTVNKAHGSKFSTLKKNSKTYNAVNKLIDNIIKTIKATGYKSISKYLSDLDKYYTKEYITQSFYDYCYQYENNRTYKKQAEAQKEQDVEDRASKAESIRDEKVSNIEQEYNNKLNKNQHVINTKTNTQQLKQIQGKYLNKSDYDSMNRSLNSRNTIIDNEIKDLYQQIDDAFAKDTNFKNTQQYYDWMAKIYGLEEERSSNTNLLEENNNAINNLKFTKLERLLSVLQSIKDLTQSRISLSIAKGNYLSESDISTEIAQEEESYNISWDKKKEAKRKLRTALVNAGIEGITENSTWAEVSAAIKANPNILYYQKAAADGKSADVWYEEVNQYNSDMVNAETNIANLKTQLRDEVLWRPFERARTELQETVALLQEVSALISNDMFFDKDGKMTEFAVAQLSNYDKQLAKTKTALQQYYDDYDELLKLQAEGYYNGDAGQDAFEDRLNEIQQGILTTAGNAQSLMNSIVDIYRSQAQEELNQLNKVISKRQEALNKKKAYYDYDKSIKDRNEDIKALEAQIAALEGVEDAESRAKKARLEETLQKQKEDLDDAIQQHSFELSSEMLSDLSTALQEAFDDKWDHISSDLSAIQDLVDKSIQSSSANTGKITDTLTKLLTSLGVSDTGTNIVSVATHADGIKKVTNDEVALTQEDGMELLVTKYGMLTPLKKGDGVVPAELTERLYNMALSNDVGANAQKSVVDYSHFDSLIGNVTITQHYDNLINIEGSADAATVEDLKRFSTEILQKSYEYTSDKLYSGYRRSGGVRTI